MSLNPITRRQALLAGGCSLCGAASAHAESAERSCADIEATPAIPMTKSDEERHAIFILLAMALLYDGWSVDRTRPDLIAAYAKVEPDRRFPDAEGHHVAALVVDPDWTIVSFALNRNIALNSSLEHAEARAIRNAIRIANASADGGRPKRWSYGDILRGHRVYATLEPCVQCAGIMDIANVGAAIYGQGDPGQGHFLNVLFNMPRPAGHSAPSPVPASFAPYWNRLSEGYADFQSRESSGSSGATRFLETVQAYEIYRDAARDFATMKPAYPENSEPLRSARAFRARWGGQFGNDVAPC